ncbi:MAG: hypothetical protein IJS96_02635 [Schwartzia sp.]|nr:hypothetical protein [Schwartzia sp. (in: firmicutes)]
MAVDRRRIRSKSACRFTMTNASFVGKIQHWAQKKERLAGKTACRSFFIRIKNVISFFITSAIEKTA